MESGLERHQPLSSHDLQHIPFDRIFHDGTCAICINPLTTDIATVLPCGHIFDATCIRDWGMACAAAGYEVTCPSCRTPCVPQDLYFLGFRVKINAMMGRAGAVHQWKKWEEERRAYEYEYGYDADVGCFLMDDEM
ncbi:hypothetical protein EDC01DRAFT_781048 [Geopyxis carbonaria]|nr:hypothetical protein EDC01DRAFT_781048 [Geopyxis carbonaria]